MNHSPLWRRSQMYSSLCPVASAAKADGLPRWCHYPEGKTQAGEQIPLMHITMVENSKLPRDTHNNLNVSIIKERSSRTSHIGNGIFKFSTIGPHLKREI